MAIADGRDNEPRELNDDELTEVSGGTVPDEIMAFVDLLPESRRRALNKCFQDNEKEFLSALSSMLGSEGYKEEEKVIDRYRALGHL